jgi:glycerate kinase
MMIKVLVAMDSFKGSISSKSVSKAVAQGIKKVFPDACVIELPLADGGEGTVATIIECCNGQTISAQVHSPLGELTEACFGLLHDGTAVIEMAQASGLTLVAPKSRNPLVSSTYGTGELIKKALDLGVNKIIIGIGGSATNDGGAGMAEALGVRFLDSKGNNIPQGGGFLKNLTSIDMSGLDARIKETEIIVMCDVDNPICGPNGASKVFGGQKGATPEMIDQLEDNLLHFAHVIKKELNIDILNLPGGGSAGGLGAGLFAFLGAKLKPGINTLLDIMEFDKHLTGTDSSCNRGRQN